MNNYRVSNLDHITFNPRIMAGQACICGMRIPVSLIVNLVANDKPFEEILEEYPDLELDDIKHSLQYAASITRKQPLQSPKGLCADLKVDITDEDIPEARKEMWNNFN
ncbi:MAG: DUF433 domain-containing protein [Waterburya sp.]